MNLAGLQRRIDRLDRLDVSEAHRFIEPGMSLYSLSTLTHNELILLSELVTLKEMGISNDMAEEMMGQRYALSRKSLEKYRQEYSRQEQALKEAQDAKRPAKKARYKAASPEGVQAYLKDLGHLKPDEIRADTTPPSDVNDIQMGECEDGSK